MVTQSLPLTHVGNLRTQGYRLETTYGWDTHEIPLYVHKDGAVSPKGNIAIRMRVGNLKSLDRAEAMYLANKGKQGFFAWPPSECLEHDFTKVEIKRRPGGGVISERVGEKLMGCKWCRVSTTSLELQEEEARPQLTSSEDPSARKTTDESSVATADPLSPAIDGVACSLCNAVMSSVTKSGKPRSQKQQLHALKLHTTRSHA